MYMDFDVVSIKDVGAVILLSSAAEALNWKQVEDAVERGGQVSGNWARGLCGWVGGEDGGLGGD
jgi:hypothetical protein